jgi:hypothetical protein
MGKSKFKGKGASLTAKQRAAVEKLLTKTKAIAVSAPRTA